MRRARRRGRRDDHRIPAPRRSKDRRLADGPHHHHLQYVVDAGRRARRLGLHGHDARRVLPADGLRRAAPRRLDLALGAGDARDVGPARGDPGRGGLPGRGSTSARAWSSCTAASRAR
jgi:hypothetical protein